MRKSDIALIIWILGSAVMLRWWRKQNKDKKVE